MLKPLVPIFRLDLTTRSKDVAEKKQVPVKLKPIVRRVSWILCTYMYSRCPFKVVQDALSNSQDAPNLSLGRS